MKLHKKLCKNLLCQSTYLGMLLELPLPCDIPGLVERRTEVLCIPPMLNTKEFPNVKCKKCIHNEAFSLKIPQILLNSSKEEFFQINIFSLRSNIEESF